MSSGDLINSRAWNSFFKGGIYGTDYNILMHRSDGLQTLSIIPGMQIIDHIPEARNAWGQFSLVKVMKNLFQVACTNQRVTKCILLSGDSIPLCPFNEFFSQAMSNGPETGTLGLTRLDLIDGELLLPNETHRERERTANKESWPRDWPWQWRGHSQWIILPRKHVQKMIDHFHVLQSVFGNSEIPDEHALGVFFNGLNMLDSLRNPHFMFADWEGPEFANCPECLEPHGVRGRNPRTTAGVDITSVFVENIRRNRPHFIAFRKVCSRSPIQENAPWLRNYICYGKACRDNFDRFPYTHFLSHGEGGRGDREIDQELFCPRCDVIALADREYREMCDCIRCRPRNVIQEEEEEEKVEN
jgi:hypothetical protein